MLFSLYLSSTPSFPRALIPQIQALRQRKVLEPTDSTQCMADSQSCKSASWAFHVLAMNRIEAFTLYEVSRWCFKALSLVLSSVCVVSVETSTLDVFEAPVTSSAPRPHPQSPRRPQHPLPSRLNILAQPAQELGPPAQVQVCAKVSLYWVAYPEELLLSLLLLGIAQNVHLKNKLHVSAAAPGSTAINGTRPPAYFWNGQ